VFRIHENETVVSFLNTNKSTVNVNSSRFEELKLEGKPFKNVLDNSTFVWGKELQLNQGFTLYSTNH
jgi:hypothetical protein